MGFSINDLLLRIMKQETVQYERQILNKFRMFNSLFMNLPYEKIENIGMLIPILRADSQAGFAAGKNPVAIIEEFFARRTNFKTEKEQHDFLFRIIRYIERQVVLFDSIEDAAFGHLNRLSADLTFEKTVQRAESQGQVDALRAKLSDFGIRIVFTAHPTQFYPEAVQYIIEDLRAAVAVNDTDQISLLLHQLGKTSFLNDTKPTPYDEALSIIYYLRYVYYDAVGRLYEKLTAQTDFSNEDLIQLGFWPGGDRDGNPYVTAEITRKTADQLRMSILKSYYNHLKSVRRRLTFKNVKPLLDTVSDRLYAAMFASGATIAYQDILQPLTKVKKILTEEHDGLFAELLEGLIVRVKIFKTHFAALDIRQDSSIHRRVMRAVVEKYNLSDLPFDQIGEQEMIEILTQKSVTIDENDFADSLIHDTIKNIKQLPDIQARNGEQGCNRYIISNSEDIFAVLYVFGLFRFCGIPTEKINFDIIPLFETMTGMEASEEVMRRLYTLPIYAAHLARRKRKQTIMLGFSDGTKDGGYLKANYEIFNTKETLSKVSDEYGIRVVFFDGRGGPPARGGGKTHRFYASQGKNIANHELQLTIQGQTITSMYGTVEQFMHNCEQLITAGVSNDIFEDEKTKLNPTKRALSEELARSAFRKYDALKNHPMFVPYLERMSTLKYYGRANIGSRPAKRGKAKELTLSDLRAISFVGSWSQLKQNVPGWFGIGTALYELQEAGRIEDAKDLFEHSAFFKTLILNSMMSLSKTFFPLTAYMRDHAEFGGFWQILYDEYRLSLKMMLDISGYDRLMQEELISKLSIETREQIVLPLLTIQQYALQKIAAGAQPTKTYESLVKRSLYGNINASRNSA